MPHRYLSRTPHRSQRVWGKCNITVILRPECDRGGKFGGEGGLAAPLRARPIGALGGRIFYLFQGDVSPRRRRVTFATAQKSPKGRSGGGVFRFPPPPENPYPAPTNQGGLRSPLLDVPPGDGGRKRDDTGRKLYHPIPAAPRGNSRGGASETGSTDSPLVLPHSGNGREDGDASEATPRRYIYASLPNQALLVTGVRGPTPPVRGRWPKARGGRVGD